MDSNSLRRVAAVLIYGSFLTISTVCLGQTPQPANPVTDAARALLPTHEKNLMAAFRAMPEEKYGFKPTPELMPFSELARHIAGANFYWCRVISGVKPTVKFPAPNAPKDELVDALRQSFEFCRPIVANLKDSSLGESIHPTPVVAPNKTETRAMLLIEFLSGMDHHYGQAAAYLRLNGVLPPTAQDEANAKK